MKFSLWIIKEWFSDYAIEYDIQANSRSIQFIRLYSEFQDHPDAVLCVVSASDYIVLKNKSDYVNVYTNDLPAVTNILLEKIAIYNNWSEGLRKKMHQIESEEVLLNESTDIFPDSILMLSDTSYFTHAFSYNSENENIISLISRVKASRNLDIDSVLDIEKSTLLNRHSRSSYKASLSDGSIKGSLRNLYVDNELIGWLLISNMNETVPQSTLHLQDELGDIIEEWFTSKLVRKELWMQSGLFIDLLEGIAIPSESLKLRLFLLGWEIEHDKCLYLISLNDSQNAIGIVARRINELSPSLHCFRYAEYIVVVTNISKLSTKAFEKKLCDLLHHFDYRCAKSNIFQNMSQLGIQYKLLSGVIDDLNDKSIHAFSDLSIKYAFSRLDVNEASWLIDNGINEIKEYDSMNGTELLKTLKVFLFENCNYTATAKLLNIHRSTLIYRMNKIYEIGEIDINNSIRRKKLMFSFMVMEAMPVRALA